MSRHVAVLLVALLGATTACSSTAGREAAETRTTATTEPPVTTTTAPTEPTTTETTAAPGAPTEPPGIVASPEGVAAQVAEAEQVVRDPATPDSEVAGAAHVQQVGYRVVAEHPDWLDPFLDALPEHLRTDALAQVAARQEFIGMHSVLEDGPPAEWRIVEPPPVGELLGYYQEAEESFGVEWEVLAAVNLVETGMGRIRGVSSAGAQGPMQFLPTTWERWGAGGDIQDPRDAILAAGRYLAASGAERGDLDAALFEYNNHDNYVRGVQRYAEIMRQDPDTYRGFYHWQIYYRTNGGDLLLPHGYPDVPAAGR